MKAIYIEENGDRDCLKFGEMPDPVIGADEVLVKADYAGINFIDVYFRKGVYKAPSFPFILGKEAVGEVVEVGSDVKHIRKGDIVGECMGVGTYAEYFSLKADKCVIIPQGVPGDLACAALLQGFTAHYLLNSVYSVKKGDKILVHAAAGGVGRILCQMAKEKGAYVIGTVSTEEKKQEAQNCGADHVIVYNNYEFAEEVESVVGKKALAAVYDSVGQPTFLKGLELLKPRGMMAIFGQSAGVVQPFDPALLASNGSLFITRPTLGHYILNSAEILERGTDVFAGILTGKIKYRIGNTYNLEDAAKAHYDLENRLSMGKLLLKV